MNECNDETPRKLMYNTKKIMTDLDVNRVGPHILKIIFEWSYRRL